MKVGKLPSMGLIQNIMLEAQQLAKGQVREELLKSFDPLSETGATLHSDGTSKFHRHFQNFQFTTKEGKTLSAGLTEMAGGDASKVMEAFNECVDSLASTLDRKSVV